MVHFLPNSFKRYSRRAPGVLGRATPAVALAAWVGIALSGCQQGPRFAEGNSQTPGRYPVKADTDEREPFFIPPPPLNRQPIAKAPTRFPAAWSPRAPQRPWKWIVIHHSATPDGGAARFDKEHRNNGWDELGYHFVIGNGTDTRDGLVEVGARWTKQKHGAHAKTPDNRFNDYGIGVCLVGNFEAGRPSQKQMQSLATVVAYLMQRYDIPPERVIGHDDTGRSTACPGHNLEMQLAQIRRAASDAVARGVVAPESQAAVYAIEQR
jgi:hypothetical protein